MDSFQQEQLTKCKTIKDLDNFVKRFIPPKSTYQKYFVSSWKRYTDKNNVKQPKFNEAVNKVWTFMLQQENPVYLGKTSDHCKIQLTAIHGMECSGH